MKTVSLPLEIVWRNPKPVRRCQRWEAMKENSSSVLYIVQEFLSTGADGFWYTASCLEIISCRPANAITESGAVLVWAKLVAEME